MRGAGCGVRAMREEGEGSRPLASAAEQFLGALVDVGELAYNTVYCITLYCKVARVWVSVHTNRLTSR